MFWRNFFPGSRQIICSACCSSCSTWLFFLLAIERQWCGGWCLIVVCYSFQTSCRCCCCLDWWLLFAPRFWSKAQHQIASLYALVDPLFLFFSTIFFRSLSFFVLSLLEWWALDVICLPQGWLHGGRKVNLSTDMDRFHVNMKQHEVRLVSWQIHQSKLLGVVDSYCTSIDRNCFPFHTENFNSSGHF